MPDQEIFEWPVNMATEYITRRLALGRRVVSIAALGNTVLVVFEYQG